MDPREIALRLGTALLFGAIIGFERQWRQRMAGLRTNALVSVGAAGFVGNGGLRERCDRPDPRSDFKACPLRADYEIAAFVLYLPSIAVLAQAAVA